VVGGKENKRPIRKKIDPQSRKREPWEKRNNPSKRSGKIRENHKGGLGDPLGKRGRL